MSYTVCNMTKFDEIYQGLLRDIMTKGIPEFSERTRLGTKALPGVHFQTDLEADGFPLLTLRLFLYCPNRSEG